MNKLKEGEFYNEIIETITELDELANGDYSVPLAKWFMAQSALKHITRKNYTFTRTDEFFGIVNDDDYSDFLIKIERN